MKYRFPKSGAIHGKPYARAICQFMDFPLESRVEEYVMLLGLTDETILPEYIYSYVLRLNKTAKDKKRKLIPIVKQSPSTLPGERGPKFHQTAELRVRLYPPASMNATPSFPATTYFSDDSITHFGGPGDWLGLLGKNDLLRRGASVRWEGATYVIEFP
jgi:hypothetical protein